MAQRNQKTQIINKLELTDQKMARVVEDLTYIMVHHGLMKYSDLRDETRAILKEREYLREQLRYL